MTISPDTGDASVGRHEPTVRKLRNRTEWPLFILGLVLTEGWDVHGKML
ncbi:hypothetical protein [Corynebacterium meridianum]|uniref:Uncharacterized protein n=1 Tax=Corynebacterium meridianum TaxID=2765363 RepID=A0A934I7G8_9CORY|nr:hypothetical protein [Corynebacterium meridianum]MBI8989865.1 hypothetical protein [Corynebacterium meridianum]MCK7677722.1 hypothetical protein [Corynebacterium meridianum]